MSELQALLEIQNLDNTLDQLHYKHENLPERAQIAEFDAELSSLNAAWASTEANRDQLRRRQRELEVDASDVEEKAQMLDRRLYGGMVTSPKEATAMADEIAALRSRQSDLEDQSIELLVEIEPLDEQLLLAEASRGELEARRAAALSGLEFGEAEIDAEIAVDGAAREGAASGVDPKLLEHYRKLRITYGPSAIVEFDPDRGGGCPVAMSAVELDRWKHLPAGTLEPCVDCGRLVAKLT